MYMIGKNVAEKPFLETIEAVQTGGKEALTRQGRWEDIQKTTLGFTDRTQIEGMRKNRGLKMILNVVVYMNNEAMNMN